jgi:hypothetical protein
VRVHLIVAVALLGACGHGEGPGFGVDDAGEWGEAPTDEPGFDEQDVDAGEPGEPDEDPGDDVDPDDPADPSDGADAPEVSWDAWPSDDLPVGTIWVGLITCSLLDGDTELWMERTPEGWFQIRRIEDHPAAEELPEAFGRPQGRFDELCRPQDVEPDRRVDWGDDGSIHFYSASWDHDLRPTSVPGRWQGTVVPMFELSEACVAELDALGVPDPAVIQLNHLGTW